MCPSALKGAGALALAPQEGHLERVLSTSTATHEPPRASLQRVEPLRLVGAPQRGQAAGGGDSVAPGTTTSGTTLALGSARVPMLTSRVASLHGPVCSKPGIREGSDM